MSTAEPPVMPSSPTSRWVLTAPVLASDMAFIDGMDLNVALPIVQRDIGASGPALFWVLNAYFLMLAALILPGGALGDRRGRRAVFMVGVLIFTGASPACGLAPDVATLVGARAAQGLGGAFMIPNSLALITALSDPAEKGPTIGVWSAATTVVTVAGPLLGGWLAEFGLWRYVFFVNVPLGALAWGVLYRFVPESADAAGGRAADRLPRRGAGHAWAGAAHVRDARRARPRRARAGRGRLLLAGARGPYRRAGQLLDDLLSRHRAVWAGGWPSRWYPARPARQP